MNSEDLIRKQERERLLNELACFIDEHSFSQPIFVKYPNEEMIQEVNAILLLQDVRKKINQLRKGKMT